MATRHSHLRRRLDPSLPPLGVCGAEELTQATRTLSAGADGNTVNDLLAERNDDEPSVGIGAVTVNGRLPDGRGNAMSATLLSTLSALPPEFQYRFVDRDLVLIDIDADLAVDVLPDALTTGRADINLNSQGLGRSVGAV